MSARPTASVSLDLDNLWSYMKTHGDPDWETRPTYIPLFVPRVLEALGELDLCITFFIVGIDASKDENMPALASLAHEGHEIGNHSHEHEPWLHQYAPDALEQEIANAEEAIMSATGNRPRGFRGPGYSWSRNLLAILARRGYRYDASTFPTFLGPLARTYYFWTARLSESEREERRVLFGTFGEGFRPITPYRWDLGQDLDLLEIPVTTAPVARIPFHLSYLVYLSRWSEPLALGYLRSVIMLCRTMRVEPSFLLHPLDLLSGEEVPQLRFFPGMDLPLSKKARIFRRTLGMLKSHFDLVSLSRHAEVILERGKLRSVAPATAA